jgi:replication initiation and membrane attachment protein DnaB
MELFPPLTGFYKAIADDTRIGATHISLYMALLQQWNLSGGLNPIKIHRHEIMKVAKINARDTYNRCMNNLKEFGYIQYEPSSNGSVQSLVILNNCEIEK